MLRIIGIVLFAAGVMVWFIGAKFLQDNGMKPVLVNPLHLKRSKELDDHLASKNDRKNPKTIAKLII